MKGVDTVEKNTLPSKEDIAAEKDLAEEEKEEEEEEDLAEVPKRKLSKELSKDIEKYDQRNLKKTISRDGGEAAMVRGKTLASEYHQSRGGRGNGKVYVVRKDVGIL